ncbi:MAG: hypothetical protein IKR58_05965, partial [Lachnospiraceae bacterium]|nr:hypothetical protein [Lachnospiraceae bacterium]
MEQYHGKSIYTGIAIGKLQLFSKEKTSVIRRQEPDSDTQIRRYEQAKEKVDGVTLPEALGNFANPNQTGSEKFAARYDLRRRVLVLK